MRYLFGLTLFLLVGTTCNANILRILDINNNPLRDAIITFPSHIKAKPKTHKITQKKYMFLPSSSIINIGDTVVFPNKDNVMHHIYSFSETGFFEIYANKGDDKQSYTFNKSGIAILGCNIHDSMTGYIHILHNESSKKTNRKGEVKFNDGIPKKLQLWHPNIAGNKSTRVDLAIEKIKRKRWIAKTNIANLPQVKAKKSGRY